MTPLGIKPHPKPRMLDTRGTRKFARKQGCRRGICPNSSPEAGILAKFLSNSAFWSLFLRKSRFHRFEKVQILGTRILAKFLSNSAFWSVSSENLVFTDLKKLRVPGGACMTPLGVHPILRCRIASEAPRRNMPLMDIFENPYGAPRPTESQNPPATKRKNSKNPEDPELYPKVNVLSPKVKPRSPKVNVKYFLGNFWKTFKVIEISCWGVTVTGVSKISNTKLLLPGPIDRFRQQFRAQQHREQNKRCVERVGP